MTTTDMLSEDPIEAQLDQEITDLQNKITQLRDRRALLTSTLLSNKTASDPSHTPASKHLADHSQKQQSHKQENLYRLAAGVTTFSVRDPDPKAVDGGRVLGVRFEVCTKGKYLRPYYVLLNKPYADSSRLRVHRHTVPPCIPLAELAAKHLAGRKAGVSVEKSEAQAKRQDFVRFVRLLRREILNYHHRVSAISSLRKAVRLDGKGDAGKGKERELVMSDISAADAEAKHVTLEWVDGKIGRMVLNEKGNIVNCAVMNGGVRDRAVERDITAHQGSLDGLVNILS